MNDVVPMLGKTECYALYLANGRSIKRVHEQTSIPEGTLKSWAYTERWSERAKSDEAAANRNIMLGAQAWRLRDLSKTTEAIDEMIAQTEDVARQGDDGLIYIKRATPPQVRAKLLIHKLELAGITPAAAGLIDGDDGDEAAVDPRDLKDDELFGVLKSEAHRR